MRATHLHRVCAIFALAWLTPSHIAVGAIPVAVSRDTVPARLVFTVQPVTTAPNGAITPAIEVTIQDSAGQTVTSFTGMVTLEITDGTGNEDAELSGTTSVAAVAGVARFTDLVIDAPGTGYTLTASAPGLTGATSTPFDIGPAGAAGSTAAVAVADTAAATDTATAAVAVPIDSTKQIVFTVQPTGAGMEATIAPAITVSVQDDSGRVVPEFSGEVTLAITDGTGNAEAELVGTATVAFVAGVATFSDLNVDEPGNGFTLTANAPGLAPAISGAFDITRVVDATMRLVFSVQPHNTAAGTAMSPGVVVAVQDAAGQPATSFTGEVTLELTEGTGNEDAELAGMTVAAVAGVATFPALSVDLEANGYTLTATATGLPDANSAAFNVTAGAKVALRVTPVASGITLDGRLDETGWASADSIANLVTIEPEEGGTPAGQTTVKVIVNPTELIFGIVCHDSNPSGIVAFAKTRDFELELEDYVLIVLDPFQDGRSGYVFAVNPNGARFDGLVAEQGEEVNTDWDAIWEAVTSRDAAGWYAEIRIPIKSLSFKPGLDAWGFNVERSVQRLLEVSRWAGANRDYEIYQTSHAGLLTGLPPFDLGLGLSIRPSLVGNANKPAPDEDRAYKGEFSLDATKKLGSNLVASLTVNTDFAETEVDARQTNLTRFDLLFPEKRTFFLEGADIFAFGLGTGEDLIPFQSRRIGLQGTEEEQLEIPISVGGKLNGRVGNTNIGALAVHTRRADTLSTDATMAVVRIKQNVLSESSVGMIATVGDPLRLPGSWMGGVDFTYQTSAFRGDKNLLVGVWGLQNHSSDGSDEAFGVMIDYPNDLWDVAMSYKWIGEDFTPSLAFVPRTGVQILQATVAFNPRPSWSLVRQMFFEVNPSIVSDVGNHWESYELQIKPLDWQLESGDRVEFTIVPQGDRPTEDFELFSSGANTVVVPADIYRWTRYGVQAAFASKRRVNGEASFSIGSFYGGTLNSMELTLRMKPSAFLTAELGMERNSAQLPGGDFVQRLYTSRVQVNVSADLQVASFVQYDNESRSLGTNTRLRWTFNPLGEMFVVFNHNLVRDIDNRFGFDSNQLLIKAQYAYRF